MHSPRWMIVLGAAALLAPLAAAFALNQEPAPPSAAAPSQPAAPAPQKPKKQKYSHANDFLILGTVFDEKGLAFPGVQLRIRRGAEKKFRWESYTNSRGEFAMRVPQGTVYEMVVHAKGFADQTQTLDAKTGVSEARIVFRMVPLSGEKK